MWNDKIPAWTGRERTLNPISSFTVPGCSGNPFQGLTTFIGRNFFPMPHPTLPSGNEKLFPIPPGPLHFSSWLLHSSDKFRHICWDLSLPSCSAPSNLHKHFLVPPHLGWPQTPLPLAENKLLVSHGRASRGKGQCQGVLRGKKGNKGVTHVFPL